MTSDDPRSADPWGKWFNVDSAARSLRTWRAARSSWPSLLWGTWGWCGSISEGGPRVGSTCCDPSVVDLKMRDVTWCDQWHPGKFRHFSWFSWSFLRENDDNQSLTKKISGFMGYWCIFSGNLRWRLYDILDRPLVHWTLDVGCCTTFVTLW